MEKFPPSSRFLCTIAVGMAGQCELAIGSVTRTSPEAHITVQSQANAIMQTAARQDSPKRQRVELHERMRPALQSNSLSTPEIGHPSIFSILPNYSTTPWTVCSRRLGNHFVQGAFFTERGLTVTHDVFCVLLPYLRPVNGN